MRWVGFGALALCVVGVVCGVEAADQDDFLTRFWKEQRQTQRPQMLGSSPDTKVLTGLEFGTTTHELLAKAAPDECFTEIGGPRTAPPCTGESQPKVNGGYVWSMVDVGSDVWFGTVANTQCIIMSTLISQALPGVISPHETTAWVCEFGDDVYDPFDDQRPPKIYLYDTAADVLVDKTGDLDAAGTALLQDVIGLRAAGTADDVVLLAGPTVDADVHIFAFETDGTYIGAAEVGWTDIRRFANLGDALYLGVGLPEALPTPAGGAVLRWTGNVASPFQFTPVTALLGEPVAELIAHEGRLAAGTWGNPQVMYATNQTSGIWISPDPGADGILSPADGAWAKIWQVGDYDPDPLTSIVTGIGAMASYGGNLHWGTVNPPLLTTAAHVGFYQTFYSDISSADALEEFMLAAFLGTHRATSFWAGADVTGTPAIEMLYGLPLLPVFTPDVVGPDPIVEDYWQIVDTGWEAAWGISGFGNLLNCYTWSAAVNNGRLWVGTMDWTFLLTNAGATLFEAFLQSQNITFEELIEEIVTATGTPEFLAAFIAALADAEELTTTAGADLLYFPFPDAPAFPESLGGIDNYTSYGVRNLLSVGGNVYAGMANPMNLLTDTTDDVPEGGWELIRLEDKPLNTIAGPVSNVFLDDGTQVTLCNVTDPGYTVGVWLPTPGLEFVIETPRWAVPSDRVLLIGTSANAGPCSSDTIASVCIPITEETDRLYQLQIVDDPDLGPVPGWVDITTGVNGNRVCGDINFAYQSLMWELGYAGYLGMVTVMAQGNIPVPATTPWGQFVLVALMAAAALFYLRTRM